MWFFPRKYKYRNLLMYHISMFMFDLRMINMSVNVNMIDTEKYQAARQNMKFVTRSLHSLANKNFIFWLNRLMCSVSTNLHSYNIYIHTAVRDLWYRPMLQAVVFAFLFMNDQEFDKYRSLVLCVCFLDPCLSFCPFSFGHCFVCPSSIYGFWLSIWYLQTLLVIGKVGNLDRKQNGSRDLFYFITCNIIISTKTLTRVRMRDKKHVLSNTGHFLCFNTTVSYTQKRIYRI